MQEALRVLFVEDAPEDVELITRNLRQGGFRPEYKRVETAEELNEALDSQSWDVVICDYSLPAFSGPEALKILRSRDPDTPLIFVSGSIGEEIAVEALRLGAQDYLLKDRLGRLATAVQREVHEARQREQFREERALNELLLRASEAKFRALIENSTDGIFLLSPAREIIFCSSSVERILGFKPQQLIGTDVRALLRPDDIEEAEKVFLHCLASPGQVIHRRSRLRHNDGSWRITDGVCSNLLDDPNIRGVVINFRDATEAAAAEHALHKSEERFSKAFHASPLAISISTLDERIFLDANPAFLKMFGYQNDEVIGRTVEDLDLWVDPEVREDLIQRLKRSVPVEPVFGKCRTKAGDVRDIIMVADVIELDGTKCLLGISQDITETKRLEAQFRQAQKMEAVGRLAGGIAHDFNNLLMIMGGAADLLQEKNRDPEKAQKYIGQIRDSVDRAARLTRQLLAFSRQQVLLPTVLDLNITIRDLVKMTARLLGEDIKIELDLDAELGRVEADRGQIEQVIMNLAVNARDAMPEGGQLTITTANVTLKPDQAGMQRPGFTPGEHVMVAVSDTGAGMDPETQTHVFEPFFTTKELGKGTGLGLATVYGIVKQSNGSIWVYSEPGRGTTFKIYFPRVQKAVVAVQEVEPVGALDGNETILVAEDEQSLRQLVVEYLASKGYRIIEAVDGPGAIAASEKEEGKIDAVLTDLIMPGFGGLKLAEALLEKRPSIRVILISGYTDRATKVENIKFKASFLQKPFSLEVLARTLRTALDNPR